MIRTVLALAVLAACAWSPTSRAETVNCTVISSLPATLTTQGVYCLKHDVTTGITSGAAITVAANNITIDCNGYKIGGLSAGPATMAVGIKVQARLNLLVRACNLRGFRAGVYATGGGHVVEQSRFDGNIESAIMIEGDGNTVRGNQIFDTGGAIASDVAGIYGGLGSVDVIDNAITGVGLGTTGQATGITLFSAAGAEVRGNRIRDVQGGMDGEIGIMIYGVGATASIRDNTLFSPSGYGIYCGSSKMAASGNHVVGFDTHISFCTDGGGNVLIAK